MKHIYKGLVLLSAAFAFGSIYAVAQETTGISTESTDSLGNIVEIPFRTIDQKDLLGGVSVINMSEFNDKAYTTGSFDLLSTVGGANSNNIWGMTDYLVLVDGMVRDANNVLPSEIEQITVLKGAAAVVLYGSRAAKGAIIITTKRGKKGDLTLNITANTGLNFAKSYPKYLGSAEYMTLHNEALVNDGKSPIYSDETIYNTATGANPYRYADLDMYSSDYLRKFYNKSDVIAEVTGGTDKVKFYSTTGYSRESSLLKVGKAKDNYVSRFFVRGNVDMKLHELLTAQADANVTFYDSYSAAGDWWKNAATWRPNLVSPLIPISYIESNDAASLGLVNNSNYIIDGKYFFGGTQEHPTNPVADSYAAGDSKYVSRQFQFNTRFDLNLKPLLNGLFFRAKYGIDYASTYDQGYSNKYATFTPSWTNYAGSDMIASLTQNSKDSKSGNENISNSAYRYTYNGSVQFDYNQSFNEKHNVFAMVLANAWQRQTNGVYHRTTNVNLGLQLSYNYDHKYYVDFSSAMPYSAKLPDGKRGGFSPTLTLGWRPVKEDFLKNSIFDDLMISASAGIICQDLDITDGDGNDYYLYKSIMKTGGWYSWADLGGLAATEFQRGDNMDLTFVKRKEINVGVRGSLLNRLISFDINFFTNKVDGLLTRPNSIYPVYFNQVGYPTSSIIPFVNYNIDNRKGFDFAFNFNKKFGKVDATLGVTGMYYTSEAGKRDENYANAYQTRVGRALSGWWGLKSDGLFQDATEAAKANQFETVMQGDIKYIDQDNNGVIDSNDEVFLGRSDDPFTLGLNFTLKWKDLTFFALGNGYFGGHGMKNNSYWWCKDQDKYSEAVRDRWTKDNTDASYPRLTTGAGTNNFRTSDFWMYDKSRFNLTQVQLTYSLPKSFLGDCFIKGLNVYLSGYNLLTIAKESKVLEMNVGSAPQTRFVNFGFKGTF